MHVIAATNRDLAEAVGAGEFRRDLLHRLQVLAFEVPPLRARPEDIPLLARHFTDEIGSLYARQVTLAADAEESLVRYPWPGNVRELRNVVERAVLLSGDGEIGAEAFAGVLQAPGAGPSLDAHPFVLPEAGLSLADLERDLLQQALDRTEGNRTRAAALLGLTRDTLRYRLEKFDLK